MTEEDLISLRDRTQQERHTISAKGGRATKGIRKYGSMKCKNCILNYCPLRDRGITENWRCKVPDINRLILEARMDPSKLLDKLFVKAFEMDSSSGNDFNKIERTFYALLHLKDKLDPAVNKHIIAHTELSPELRIIIEAAQKARKEKEGKENGR